MGRERTILQWDARESVLRSRIEKIEQQLAGLGASAGQQERAARLHAELDELRRQLRALGPSPRAKMG